MRNLIFVLFSFLFVEIVNAQVKNQEYVERIIDVNYKVDTANLTIENILPRYVRLDTSDILYEYIFSCYNYAYCMLNYSIRSRPQKIKIHSMNDIENVIDSIRKDYVKKLINNRDYMFSLNYFLTYKTKNEIGERDSINLDDLINIASKYFYVYKFENDSLIRFSFCSGGANPYLLQPELSTNIIAESFAFKALGGLLEKGDWSLIDKMKNEINPILLDTLKHIDSDMNYDQKLNLLRQITWNEMKKDEKIKDAILEEYKRSKDIIPLKIIF